MEASRLIPEAGLCVNADGVKQKKQNPKTEWISLWKGQLEAKKGHTEKTRGQGCGSQAKGVRCRNKAKRVRTESCGYQ